MSTTKEPAAKKKRETTKSKDERALEVAIARALYRTFTDPAELPAGATDADKAAHAAARKEGWKSERQAYKKKARGLMRRLNKAGVQVSPKAGVTLGLSEK